MKKILTILMMAILAAGVGWAATSTLTFTAACGGSGTASDGASWTVTSDASESTFDSSRGIHYGTGSVPVSYLNLTTSDISGTITQIKVNAAGASKTTAKCNVTVGGSAFGSQVSLTSSATEYTFTGSASGTIVVSLSQESATRALYVKSIEVTYDDGTVEPDPETPTATVSFSQAAGEVAYGTTVTLSLNGDATGIKYTLDGSDPTGSSDNYTDPIAITAATTIKAAAYNYSNSKYALGSVSSATYTLQAVESVKYSRVTSLSASDVGKKFLLVCESKNTGMGVIGSYGESISLTTLSNGQASITYEQVLPVTLGGTEGAWTFQTPDGNYLSWDTGNVLKATESGNTTWNVSFEGNNAMINNNVLDGTDTRTIKYNSSNPRFACYKSGQTAIQLYREGEAAPIEYTNVASVAEFNVTPDNANVKFTGNLVAVAQKGRYLYAQDDTKGILIYGDINQTYTPGSVIPAGFTGTKTTFSGAPEMTNPSGFEASTSIVEVTPIELIPSEVTLDNFGRYAVIRGATISDGNIVVADESVPYYTNTLGVAIPEDCAGKTYDITGVCGYYNNAQFMPLSFTEVEAVTGSDYYLAGNFNGWGDALSSEANKFTKRANGSYVLNKTLLDPTDAEGNPLEEGIKFKIVKVENGTTTWLGGEGTQGVHDIKSDYHTNINLVDGLDFHMTDGGKCTFTISSDQKLAVDKEEMRYITGSFNGWKKQFMQNAAGWVYTIELEVGAEFKFRNEWGDWLGTNELSCEQLGTLVTSADGGNFKIVEAGNYTFRVDGSVLEVTTVQTPHNITIAQGIENGTVTASHTQAVAGETITLTAAPAQGYVLDAFAVMAGETAIEVVGNTFVMPDQDVTVSATFKEFVLASYFKLVTNINELDGGKQILFAGVNDDDVYVMSAPAANGNNMTAQAVVNPTSTPPSFLSYTDGYKVFSLGEFGDNYTFYDVETQKYLRATSSTSNRMGLGDLDDNATASIGLNEESTFDVVFQGEFTHNNMRFNINASNNSPLFACYQETSTMPRVYIYVETEGIPQPVVLEGVAFTADRQWATWYGDASLALPEDVTAYVVTGVQGDAVAVEALDYIPANTGVLLYSETAAESVSAMPYTGEAGTIPANLLMGGLETQTVSNAYLLYNNQFILAQDGTTVGAHRCYLPMSASAQGVPVLKIGTPGTVTGIETISTNGNGDNTYYNLMGQPVANPTPGIYIRGGKKVIVK